MITKSYTFTNNTTIDPEEVNQNFDDILAEIKAAHHSDVDGTKILPADINSDWGLVPKNGIILYSGLISAIPAGYAFCNGANGTIDLRNRVALCPGQDSGGTYDTGDVGGQATINISHIHSTGDADTPNHLHGNNHSHYVTRVNDGSGYSESGTGLADDRNFAGITMNTPELTGGADRSLVHNHGNTSSQLSATQNIMNPYKCVAYIQKI
jgi:hypothetical protein